MKRIISTAGLLVAGMAGLQADNTAGTSPMETSKPWSVSAALRGFYDDNVTTLPDDAPGKTESWGFEVMPSIALNFPLERTYIGVAYQYGFRYYLEDDYSNQDDHTHEFRLTLDHRFSDRVRLRVNDSFVYSREPEIIDQNLSTPIRTEADAIRNFLPIRLNVTLTELVGLETGYRNNWINYLDEGEGSRDSLLSRMEHFGYLDGRYTVRENLVALIGYQFGYFDYNGDDSMFAGGGPTSDIRDAYNHYFYGGAEAELMPNVTAGAKLGAQYTDYLNAADDDWSPYADLSLQWNYSPGSFAKLGFKHSRTATDVAGSPGAVTLDQEYSLIYASISQRITPKLSATFMGAYQNSELQGGVADADAENFYTLNIDLTYYFTQHWGATAGYSWDNYDSDVGVMARDFTRNRVWFGVRATY